MQHSGGIHVSIKSQSEAVTFFQLSKSQVFLTSSCDLDLTVKCWSGVNNVHTLDMQCYPGNRASINAVSTLDTQNFHGPAYLDIYTT